MIRSFLDVVESFQYFFVHRRSRAAITKWQGLRLRKLVAHAARSVPLWKEIFSGAELQPDTVRTIADLHAVPVTSKQTYIGRMAEEYLDQSRGVRTAWITTSGSSGVPFRSVQSSHYVRSPFVRDFASLRFLVWSGRFISRLSHVRMAQIKIRAASSPYRLFIPVAEFQTAPQAVYEKLVEFRPEVLMTYSSILLDLADMCSHSPVPLTIPYALSFGEMLSPAARARIESALHCEVFDRYGIEEIGVIGVECKEHDGFHVNCESIAVEIVDEAGSPVPEGVEGRVVVTDLYNFDMPFIRYDTGDYGRLSYERCACGLSSERLWIEGRHSAYLTFGSRRFHHLEFDAALDGFMGMVLQYQVRKTAHGVTVLVVPGHNFDAGNVARIRKSVEKLVGETISVTVETVHTISRLPQGKSQIVFDETAL